MHGQRFVDWLIMGLSVLAFLALVKVAAAKLPDNGFGGSVKKAVLFAA